MGIFSSRGARVRSRDELVGGGQRFAAFMSYSHSADARLAPALQAGIEQLAKSWRQRRALRVFRDQTSLSADPGLWPSIEAALRGSGHLILMASTDAARSAWVERELSWWLEHRGSPTVLIVHTDGTIAWDRTACAFSALTDALPPSALGAFGEEPRWIDLRWAVSELDISLRNPRFREAVAELAAPLHGIPKDDLVGEDIRQHRRTMRIARSGVGALAALATSTTAAGILANGEAADSRRQASVAETREFVARSLNSEDPYEALVLAVEAEERRQPSLPETRDAYARALQRVWRQPAVPAGGPFPGHPQPLAWSPDGSQFATADLLTGRVRTWTDTGQPTGVEIETDGRSIAEIDWAPNGLGFVTVEPALATQTASINLWDARSGERVGAPLQIDGLVRDVDWSPDASRLVVAAADVTILRWDPAAGSAARSTIRRTLADGSRLPYTAQAVEWSPNGAQLAMIHLGRIVFLDVGAGAESHREALPVQGEIDTAIALAWSPDGTQLAAGSEQGIVRILDVVTGQHTVSALVGHTAAVRDLTWSTDGSRLASVGDDRSLRIWDPSTGRRVGDPVLSHRGSALSVVWLPDGRLATAGSDDTVRLWRLAERTQTEGLRAGDSPSYLNSGLAFSPDGSALAFAGAELQLWDPRRGVRTESALRDAGDASALAWSSIGTIAVATSDVPIATLTKVHLLHGDDLTETGSFEVESPAVAALVWSPDGSQLAVLTSDLERSRVGIWDSGSGRLDVNRIQADFPARSMAWSPDGTEIVLGGWSVQGWRVSDGTAQGEPLQVDDAPISAVSVAFSPDGSKLATADRNIQIWDTGTHERLGSPMEGHDQTIGTLAWSPDGTLLASGDGSLEGNGTARLWDVASRESVGVPLPHPGGVQSIAWAPDGSGLASLGGGIWFWDAMTEPDACRLVGPILGSALDVVLGEERGPAACAEPDKVKARSPIPLLPAQFVRD